MKVLKKTAMREMIKNYLKNKDLKIQKGSAVKNIMRDIEITLTQDMGKIISMYATGMTVGDIEG